MWRKFCTFICVVIMVATASAPTHSALALGQNTGSNKWVKVVNQRTSGFPIFYVYIVSAGSDSWGDDQLNGNVIAAGHSYKWNIPWDGCYVDVKAVTFTGLHIERYGLNACGGVTWTLYDE